MHWNKLDDALRTHGQSKAAGERVSAVASDPAMLDVLQGFVHELRLAGLPVSIKDLTDVAGVRTTYGSPIFADHVPAKSNPLVERIERKGGVVMGKSNTPEFGAGGSTFNEVFGRTRNPWNTSLTCGGFSAG